VNPAMAANFEKKYANWINVVGKTSPEYYLN
jgi:hypothetical protein